MTTGRCVSGSTSGPDRLRYERDRDGDTEVTGRYQGAQISLQGAA